MARDRNTLRRGLFVIPGGLLAFYALAGLVYVLFVRQDSATRCLDSYRFLVGGACYNVVPLLSILLLVGLALLLVGILAFRGAVERLEGYLHSGTPTHFFLAFLISLAVLPAILAAVLRYVERAGGTFYTTDVSGYPVRTAFLFSLLTLAGILALAPYAILLGRSAARRHRFLAEARRVAPPAPGEVRSGATTPTEVVAIPPGAEALDDDPDWPRSR